MGQRDYSVEYDLRDNFVQSKLYVAFNDELAGELTPLIFDHPKGYGSKPFPPDIIAYRLILDPVNFQTIALFEVYWKRQDCSWRELNKDHDHDYEQIQVHFNFNTGKVNKVVISSIGPIECGGHGVEVYIKDSGFRTYGINYRTSPRTFFPWGGKEGKPNRTLIREIPLNRLIFEGMKPKVLVLNCYHVFTGMKRKSLAKGRSQLFPQLIRLDAEILNRWYYRNAKNRFGHDISNPFKKPYVLYYPPPESILSRLVYGLLWILGKLK